MDQEPPSIPEKFELFQETTDTEVSLFLIRHIQEPCGIKLEDGTEVNIRDFYIAQAKRQLQRMKNPFAKKLLEDEIKKYEKDQEVK